MHSSSIPSRNLPTWRNELTDYPWPSHFAQLDSQQLMHYIDEGAGDPLLMVHGNPTWSFYYRHLVEHFGKTKRAIAVDHIGCGLSDKPENYPYSLDQHIDNLIQLVRQLDLNRITLLVHDWGGAIGLGAALQDLDRYHQIVLFNTGAFPPPYIPWRIRALRGPLIGRFVIQGLNMFARAAVTMATEQKGGLPKPARDGLLAPYDSWKNRQAIYRFVADIPTSSKQTTWKTLEDIESRLDEMSGLPIKLIWGMKDWCFRPECLERFQQVWPKAEVCKLADAGHYVVEDETQRVIEEVESFLNRQPSD